MVRDRDRSVWIDEYRHCERRRRWSVGKARVARVSHTSRRVASCYSDECKFTVTRREGAIMQAHVHTKLCAQSSYRSADKAVTMLTYLTFAAAVAAAVAFPLNGQFS